ncbi:hypothetical protein SAMN05216559_4209 [Halomicrobium zhouii]|uniref:Uncharacterized protein n=1 Tax=Halomicrobium zhouii TaxID=767519 RepID=A0A1I6MBQ0_9EURY|nr:hypothetical protein [Halomicrobium zhouii]SFS13149.1 hypothetical protein SAMN05216559_4209 [Halomicrobium zhouii]
MSEWSPPTVPRSWLLVAGVLFVLWLAYAVVIVQQILLGSLPLIAFATLYVGWRFLVAFEAIADGLQRIADQQEHDREN